MAAPAVAAPAEQRPAKLLKLSERQGFVYQGGVPQGPPAAVMSAFGVAPLSTVGPTARALGDSSQAPAVPAAAAAPMAGGVAPAVPALAAAVAPMAAAVSAGLLPVQQQQGQQPSLPSPMQVSPLLPQQPTPAGAAAAAPGTGGGVATAAAASSSPGDGAGIAGAGAAPGSAGLPILPFLPGLAGLPPGMQLPPLLPLPQGMQLPPLPLPPTVVKLPKPQPLGGVRLLHWLLLGLDVGSCTPAAAVNSSGPLCRTLCPRAALACVSPHRRRC